MELKLKSLPCTPLFQSEEDQIYQQTLFREEVDTVLVGGTPNQARPRDFLTYFQVPMILFQEHLCLDPKVSLIFTQSMTLVKTQKDIL